jgi:alcohol dehydrogenase (cytochrome c)
MVWSFQALTARYAGPDANETPIIFDANFDGKPQRVLFLLDRITGKDLLSAPYGLIDMVPTVFGRGFQTHVVIDAAGKVSRNDLRIQSTSKST